MGEGGKSHIKEKMREKEKNSFTRTLLSSFHGCKCSHIKRMLKFEIKDKKKLSKYMVTSHTQSYSAFLINV